MPTVTPLPGTPLRFSRALNFRELGGWPAAGGRAVRRGLLWRSGALCELDTPADRALFDSLGICYVLDLRGAAEADAAPDPALPGARQERISAMRFLDGSEIDFSPAGMARLAAEHAALNGAPGQTPDDYDIFHELYRRMAFDNPAYRALFAAMEAGEAPLLFHCSAGKDRTGIAAALILLALGADRETAMADYMQTNICRKPAIDAFFAAHARAFAVADARQRQQALAVEGVCRDMADYTLDAILGRYGTFDEYFAAEYGLTAARLDALRAKYLE